MTTRSLQKIVAVENELLAAERAEEGKARKWLQEQERELGREQDRELAELEARQELARDRARQAAAQKAAEHVASAKQYAGRLAALDDDVLRSIIKKHLVAIITGTVP